MGICKIHAYDSYAYSFSALYISCMYFHIYSSLQGKVKPVTERSAAVTDLLEPSPNFNCHVSRSIQSLPANSPLSLVFEYSQVSNLLLSFLLM